MILPRFSLILFLYQQPCEVVPWERLSIEAAGQDGKERLQDSAKNSIWIFDWNQALSCTDFERSLWLPRWGFMTPLWSRPTGWRTGCAKVIWTCSTHQSFTSFFYLPPRGHLPRLAKLTIAHSWQLRLDKYPIWAICLHLQVVLRITRYVGQS